MKTFHKKKLFKICQKYSENVYLNETYKSNDATKKNISYVKQPLVPTELSEQYCKAQVLNVPYSECVSIT